MNLENELLSLFKWLHQHPEIGCEEVNTTKRIRETLANEGVEILESPLETGLIARVTGAKPGRVIGLRCDIDALPIQEESGLEYASVNPGKMHACGHDFHTAVMLGAAILLKRQEAELAGTVKIVFQPSEENANGAQIAVDSGLLDDVEEFYGIHSYPWFEAGTLGIKEGPVMAAPDRFEITIHGKGTHAAEPNKGRDPIPAAATIALAAQSVVSRSIDPFSSAVVSIAHIEAGNTWNIIPETALLEGTVRTLNQGVREHIRRELARIAESAASTYGCTADFRWHNGPAAVINDDALCNVVRELALKEGYRVDRQEDTMGGEDFSEYLRLCPGVFIRVGTGGSYPSHHPKFTVDPNALWPAAKFFAKLAAERTNPRPRT